MSAHRRLTGKVVIATHNPGKLVEMRDLLAPYGIETVSAGDMKLAEPEETGATFAENARIKATAATKASGLPAFADDSGLVVEALDGAPGIHSARWAGPNKDFAGAMAEIERQLAKKKASDRRAHFVAALCLAWPDGHVEQFEARVDGTLVDPPRGTKGFGYDPIFKPEGFTQTFGEMDAEEKHGLPPPARHQAEWAPAGRPDGAQKEKRKGLSHRARAFMLLASACLR